MFIIILALLCVSSYPCLSMEYIPEEELTKEQLIQRDNQHAVLRKYKEIGLAKLDAADKSLSNENTLAELFALKVGQILEEAIQDQFLSDKPNMLLFREYMDDYTKLWGHSRIRGAVEFFYDKQYSKQQPKRIAWFIRDLLNNGLAEPTEEDHMYFGIANMKCYTYEIQQNRKANSKLQDEIYVSLKKGPRLEDIDPQISADLTTFFITYTFEHQLYAEHIKYCQLFRKYNKRGKNWNKDDNATTSTTIYTSQLSLAQSYFYCGLIQDAVDQYVTILNFKHTHGDLQYKRMIRSVSFENLFALYHLYLSLNNVEVQKKILAVFDYLLAQISNLQPEDIKDSMEGLHETLRAAHAQMNNTKVPKKRGQSRKLNQVELRKVVLKQFQKSQLDKMRVIRDKAFALNLDGCLQKQIKFSLDDKSIESMRRLVSIIDELHKKVNEFTAEIDADRNQHLVKCRDEMEAHYKELDKRYKTFMELIRRKIREALLLSQEANFVPFTPTPENLKKVVLADHGKVKQRIRTVGEAPDLLSTAIVNEPKIEEISINTIISCSHEVKEIFDTKKCKFYPRGTIELLEILNRSANIQELQDNLRIYDADLKKLNDKDGKWQFRINRKYRVRFEETDNGFINVEIGDFH